MAKYHLASVIVIWASVLAVVVMDPIGMRLIGGIAIAAVWMWTDIRAQRRMDPDTAVRIAKCEIIKAMRAQIGDD